METCKKCSSEIENQFENCWNCGENNPNYSSEYTPLNKKPSQNPLEERVKNFKDFGFIVVLSTFIGIPLLHYILCIKVFPEIFSIHNLVTATIITSVVLWGIIVYLWLKLFSKLG